MRQSLAALLASLLAACSHQAAGGAGATAAPREQFLLESAAADFHAHGPPGPLRFRGVRAGALPADDGAKLDILCGEVRREAGGGEWTPFVTIRTSGYEQMLGDQATAFCRRSALEERDLSAALQGRLESLR